VIFRTHTEVCSIALGSNPPEHQKNDNDYQDNAEDTHAAVTIAIAIATEPAAEATSEEDDEKNDEDEPE
jgi:hypothetical protein